MWAHPSLGHDARGVRQPSDQDVGRLLMKDGNIREPATRSDDFPYTSNTGTPSHHQAATNQLSPPG
jgi:hypothetical protein